MSSTLTERLDAAERTLRELQVELTSIRAEARPAPAERPAPVQAPPAPAPAPARPAEPPRPSRSLPSLDELLERWDLVGARGLAVAGGVVTLLGIVFFFVLAANRGWIGPGERVLLGACASALLVAGGLEARRRFGPLLAALAAVGAGIAGWYTTLAAATIRYELVSEPVALLCATAIAAVGLAAALVWSSELLASLALLGAAAAPLAIALDHGVTAAGTAFAAVVFAAIAAVAAWRRWPWLLATGTAVVVVQAIWTAADAADGDPGAVAVAGAVGALLVAAAVAWQLLGGTAWLDDVAAAFVGGSTSFLLACGWLLFADPRDRGIALLAAAAIPAAAAIVGLRTRDLAWSLAAASLALAAVATADLSSGATLAVVWGLQSLAAAGLSWRTRSTRLLLPALGYAGLAAAHALALDAPLVPDLYPRLSAGLTGAASVALAGAALLGCAALRPARSVRGSKRGVLAVVDDALDALRREWPATRTGLACAGGALAVAAGCLVLVDLMPLTGHLVVAALVGAGGAALVAVAARRDSVVLGAVALAAVALVFVKAATWDWSGLGETRAALDLLVASAALLAGGFSARALSRREARLGWVYGPAATLALLGTAAAVDNLVEADTARGAALLAVAVVYGALAASVLRRPGLRDLATTMWAHGLVPLLAGEALLLQSRAIAVAFVVTGVGLAVLATALDEIRLRIAGVVIVGGTSLVVLVDLTPPDRLLTANAHPAGSLWVLGTCALAFLALAALAADEERWLLTSIGATGLLYGVSLAILDTSVRISTASLATDFQRGHTAVSGLWGAIGLGLLVAGLVRGRRPLRIGGLVLLAVALVKLFLYDLRELSSVTRAVSFLAVGLALLAGGMVVQRWNGRGDPPAATTL